MLLCQGAVVFGGQCVCLHMGVSMEHVLQQGMPSNGQTAARSAGRHGTMPVCVRCLVTIVHVMC